MKKIENIEFGKIINFYCKMKGYIPLEYYVFQIWLLLNEDLIYYDDFEEDLYDERDLIED